MSITPTPWITPTPLRIDLANQYGLGLRVIYVIHEIDAQNEITGSELWLLEPASQDARLLYSSSAATGDGTGDTVLFPTFPETHNDEKIAFARVTKSHMVVVAAINLQSGEVEELIGPLPERDYQVALDRFSWSSDGIWLYATFNEAGAVAAGIVDVQTKELRLLNYETQDELLSWSPLRPNQYAYISRPSYPEAGGETISIGEIGSAQPLSTIEAFGTFTLLDGFTWAPDGERAIIQSVNAEGIPAYLLLDFREQTWREWLSGHDLSVTPFWSPRGDWVVLNRYDRGIFLLNIADPKTLVRIPAGDSASPIAWLPADNVLIFQDGFGVYGVYPDEPEAPFLVQDFSSVLRGIAPYFQIDLSSLKPW